MSISPSTPCSLRSWQRTSIFENLFPRVSRDSIARRYPCSLPRTEDTTIDQFHHELNNQEALRGYDR